jgi:hypothetical protein
MKRLQGISQDLSSGLRMIKDCQKDVAIRNDTDELTAFSDGVYSHCCRIAAKLDVAPAVPRICQRQQHRSNSQYSDPEEYFKVTVLIPFLDHLIADLNSRFSKHLQKASRLEAVLPTSISEKSSFEDIKEAIDFYETDCQTLTLSIKNLLAEEKVDQCSSEISSSNSEGLPYY